jgi:hypothetical protein
VSIIAAAFMNGSSARPKEQESSHADRRKFLAASVKATGQRLVETVRPPWRKST